MRPEHETTCAQFAEEYEKDSSSPVIYRYEQSGMWHLVERDYQGNTRGEDVPLKAFMVGFPDGGIYTLDTGAPEMIHVGIHMVETIKNGLLAQQRIGEYMRRLRAEQKEENIKKFGPRSDYQKNLRAQAEKENS